MTGDEHSMPEAAGALDGLDRKLDAVAAALAAVASSHAQLLPTIEESEARHTEDALDVAQRLDALERQVLNLKQRPSATDGGGGSAQADLALALDVLERLAASVERSDARLSKLEDSLDEFGEHLSDHIEAALAGMLRLIDARLAAVRAAVEEASLVPLEPTPAPAPPPAPSFEAGAVMGAAQAAWIRLEQRIEAEFDDLARQLQTMTTLVEQSLATAEAAANRPVVTSEQIRRTATSVKDAVVGASRARRDRSGRPKGLGPGQGPT